MTQPCRTRRCMSSRILLTSLFSGEIRATPCWGHGSRALRSSAGRPLAAASASAGRPLSGDLSAQHQTSARPSYVPAAFKADSLKCERRGADPDSTPEIPPLRVAPRKGEPTPASAHALSTVPCLQQGQADCTQAHLPPRRLELPNLPILWPLNCPLALERQYLPLAALHLQPQRRPPAQVHLQLVCHRRSPAQQRPEALLARLQPQPRGRVLRNLLPHRTQTANRRPQRPGDSQEGQCRRSEHGRRAGGG